MKKIWGIPVHEMWNREDGQPYEPDDFHPVVDMVNSRLFGISKDDNEDVKIIHSYHPTAQRNGAFDFAQFVYGSPDKWSRPDVSAKVVSCLGAPACAACTGEPFPFTADLAVNWVVQPFAESNELTGGRLLDSADPDCSLTTQEHLLAEVADDVDSNKIQVELMRRCIALFGAPYDMATGEVSPIYREIYNSGNLES